MGDKTQVFRSPEEIPATLRKQLVASTRGMNSATILIADRGGRAEIRKILDGQPSPLKSRLRADFLRRSLDDRPSEAQIPVATAVPQPMSIRDWKLRHWAELLLPGAVGIGLWVLFTWK